MPDAMINEEGNFPTEAFFDYLRPLVGEMPEFADLRFEPVRHEGRGSTHEPRA